MLEFQQSEQIASHRTWIIVLVDSTDGVTGKTGQTGQAYISKNGATPALSVNSIVEVDAVNMPGHYYLVLDPGELSDLGMVSITMKTASTLAFHDRGLVSYNNPYVQAGGFLAGPGEGITKTQSKSLLADIRKIVREEMEAVEAEEEVEEEIPDPRIDQILAAVTAEEDEPEPIDLSPILDRIDQIPKVDLKPVLAQIKAIKFPEIKFPEIKDYSKQLTDILESFKLIPKPSEFDYERIEKALTESTYQIVALKEAVVADSQLDQKAKEVIMTLLGVTNDRMNSALEYLINIKYDLQDQQLSEARNHYSLLSKG